MVTGLVAALVLGIGAGAIAITALVDDSKDKTVRSVTERTTTTTATQGLGSSAVPDQGTPPVPGFSTYIPSESAYYYLAELPTGEGWAEPTESHPTSGELLRTRAGAERDLVDHRPHPRRGAADRGRV